MDLLLGRDLGQKLKAEGPLDIREAIAVFYEVCAGIGYAHKKGIIHRDIKPGNIFLLEKPEPSGARVKVVDFGIAKLTVVKTQYNQSLTGVGDVVGTPYYMSPEQCMALRVDARSDVYSLGCTLYEALTGSLPFRGRNPTEIMILHQQAPIPTLRQGAGGKHFPTSMERLVATAMAKEPAERYQNMDQMARDLSAVLEGSGVLGVTQSRLPSLTDDDIDARAGTSVEVRVPTIPPGGTISVAGIAGGAGFGWGAALGPGPELEEGADDSGVYTKTNRIANAQKQLILKVVAPIVAGILVLGGGTYLYFHQQAKKAQPLPLDEQLRKFGGKTSEKLPEEAAAVKVDYERETSLLERAKEQESLGSKEPFSKIKKEGKKEYIIFNFPKDPVIGEIRDYWDKNGWKKATGEVKFSHGEWTYQTFRPDPFVKTMPECLKKFQKKDIYCVEFGPDADLQTLRACLNIPGVQELDFGGAKQLADISVNTLREYTDLEYFRGPSVMTDAARLAEAKCWEHLKEFYLPISKNITPLLRQFQNSKNLKKLGIGPSGLTSVDYELLGKLSNLDYLDINGNKATSADVANLTRLDKLESLNLIHSVVNISVLPSLEQMKQLKHLYISSPQLSKADLQKIKKALPNVKLHEHISDS
jgi:hypothetical protein